MLVKAVKHALKRWTGDPGVAGLVFGSYTDELLRRLDELLRRLGETHNKLLARPFAYEFYHQMCSLWDTRSELVAPFSEVVIQK